MSATAPTLKKNLDQRFEDSVATAMRRVANLDVRRVAVEDQRRHIGRMLSCQMSLQGKGFIGSLVLLLPADFGPTIAARRAGMSETETTKGPELAESVGEIGAAIALAFGKSFADEGRLIVGMPTVIVGGDVAVSFPWGRDFESRVCFVSGDHPFWAILRLSHCPD